MKFYNMAEGKDNQKNYVELTNDMVLEKAKEELNKLKQSFESLKNDITDNNVIKDTNKLNEINNLVYESELDLTNKEQFTKALNNLKENIRNENIDKENLKNEFDKITDLLDFWIQKELKDLKEETLKFNTWNYKKWKPRQPMRPKDIQEEIRNSSENISILIEDAKNDKSWFIRNVIARLLERANS